MENQVVTISFFRFKGLRNKLWAFSMMQTGHKLMGRTPGKPEFYKLLGSGAEDGFSWKPNFSVYGLLCVWEDEHKAEKFYKGTRIIQEYQERAEEYFTIYLSSIKSHGFWSKVNPFTQRDDVEEGGKIAVLTRATIRLSKLVSFWSRVSGVSQTLVDFSGRKFSIGVGEWPWIQQATFSIWDSEDQMKEYAYKNPVHKKIIQMTREKNWYREEMFARFRPLRVDGNWNGSKVNLL